MGSEYDIELNSRRFPRREVHSTQVHPSFREFCSSRLSTDLSSSIILSPPPSPSRDYSLRRKHLSTGSLGRYLSNGSTASLLKPSLTSNHINLDLYLPGNAVIEQVQRIPITHCIAKEVIYSNGENLGRPIIVEQPKSTYICDEKTSTKLVNG